MTSPTYNKALMREAKRNIRDAYERGNLTPEQASLLEARGFPFSSSPNAAPCADHTGRSFPSKTAMYKHWNIGRTVVEQRLKTGWTLERALTTPAASYGEKFVGEDGKEYKSERAYCKANGIHQSTYRARRERGLDSQQALTGESQVVTDHKGNTYPNIAAMCSAWGISTSTYQMRLRRGWGMETALVTPVKASCRSVPCKDHLGHQFKSTSQMCANWGIGAETYRMRIRRGYTLEEALTGKRKPKTPDSA